MPWSRRIIGTSSNTGQPNWKGFFPTEKNEKPPWGLRGKRNNTGKIAEHAVPPRKEKDFMAKVWIFPKNVGSGQGVGG